MEIGEYFIIRLLVWWTISARLELWQNHGISYVKKQKVAVIPSVDFGVDSFLFAGGGSATQVNTYLPTKLTSP